MTGAVLSAPLPLSVQAAVGALSLGMSGVALAQAQFRIGWIRPTTGRLDLAQHYVRGPITTNEINAATSHLNILRKAGAPAWIASLPNLAIAFNSLYKTYLTYGARASRSWRVSRPSQASSPPIPRSRARVRRWRRRLLLAYVVIGIEGFPVPLTCRRL